MSDDKRGRSPNELGPTGRQVSENIRRLRNKRSLTVRELARRLTETHGRPFTPGAISRVEAGTRRVDADDLVAFALALDVNPNTLLLAPTATGDMEITGTSPRPAEDVWRWADGQWPLTWSENPEELRRQLMDYHLTARPEGMAPYHSADEAARQMKAFGRTPFD
ncbi:helix-turn-helix domain-containing protein [Nocardiopsis sp. FR26]|uniref:helix-turn-helix domain-containing protein n=1 Tax=Nocardiopsis sp. FR26 TaxID=2605987 RepID=UPI001356FEA1|nr:helix-turn-helix transcriptional regulator [Nocardiopsis sp. FR26]